MEIVLCGDEKILPGLHVATFSLLSSIKQKISKPKFTIFSSTIKEADLCSVRETLSATGKKFEINIRRVNVSGIKNMPKLNNSLATYYRLLAVQEMSVERFLYIDVDTLCDLDVTPLWSLEMEKYPVAWVAEAPLHKSVDRAVAGQLSSSKKSDYYNAGVQLINVKNWMQQKISEKAIAYLHKYKPEFHDQSALNYVLHENCLPLDPKYNCLANMRKNWPYLIHPLGEINRIIHFINYPKPWDLFGEIVCPQYSLWRSVLNQTSLAGFSSLNKIYEIKRFCEPKIRSQYFKSLKDKILFLGYKKGVFRKIKGIQAENLG